VGLDATDVDGDAVAAAVWLAGLLDAAWMAEAAVLDALPAPGWAWVAPPASGPPLA
jgi:hypothetical protein